MIEAIKYVVGEHYKNRRLILKTAVINMKKQTLRTSLGSLWLYIHDIVYFSVFVLFRILMSGTGEIDGMNSVVYLITGLIPWFFINETMNVGASSIKSYKAIIQSIKFPITTIPAIEVTGVFFKRCITFLFMFAVAIYYGYLKNINLLLFVYYMFCMLIMMYALMLFISAFVAISQDLHQLYLVGIRIFMYVMPIIWGYKHIQNMGMLKLLIKLNPMVYVLDGFRSAFVYGNMPSLAYTVYFWTFVTVIFMLGCFVQFKLRKYYSDII